MTRVGIDAGDRGVRASALGEPERRVADPTPEVQEGSGGPRGRTSKRAASPPASWEQPAPVRLLVLLRLLEHDVETITAAKLDQARLNVIHTATFAPGPRNPCISTISRTQSRPRAWPHACTTRGMLSTTRWPAIASSSASVSSTSPSVAIPSSTMGWHVFLSVNGAISQNVALEPGRLHHLHRNILDPCVGEQ